MKLFVGWSALLQDSSQSFYRLGWLIWCQDFPKIHLIHEGPGAIPSFKTFLSFMNRLLAEKTMAPHSSTFVWKIPWTEEPGGLQSMGSLRVGHDWATSLSLFAFRHWRRRWQPTPVLLPGESQGRRSLVDCRLWGRTESDTTEAT